MCWNIDCTCASEDTSAKWAKERVPAGAYLLDHLIGGRLARYVVHHDVGSGLTEGQRDTSADARVGAGDQRFLPGQQFRHLQRGRRGRVGGAVSG
jgi:hypothetical protein